MKADSVASGSLTIGGTEARPVGEDTERLLGGGQNTCHNNNPHSVLGKDTEKLLWLFVDSAAQEAGNDVFFVVGV